MTVTRTRAHELFLRLQEQICAGLADAEPAPFIETTWERPGGGGGRTRVLQGGAVLEKAGVNVSAVHGVLPAEAARSMAAKVHDLPETPRFFATGVSLVLHPVNPFAPTVHANFRYFELEDGETWWFGGGADLTPSYLFREDAVHFHQTLKSACDATDHSFYPRFKAWCDEYFLIRHRGERRGVGGVFWDDLHDRPADELLAFTERVGASFLPAYLPILMRRCDTPYTDAHRRWQQVRRGRYVEFNLVWDRGTVFGLRTDARVESVLMSLPLTARWEVEEPPEPGSPEAELVEVLREPIAWVPS